MEEMANFVDFVDATEVTPSPYKVIFSCPTLTL